MRKFIAAKRKTIRGPSTAEKSFSSFERFEDGFPRAKILDLIVVLTKERNTLTWRHACVKFIIRSYFPPDPFSVVSTSQRGRWRSHERNNMIPCRHTIWKTFVTSVAFISMRPPVRRAWLSASLYIRLLYTSVLSRSSQWRTFGQRERRINSL